MNQLIFNGENGDNKLERTILPDSSVRGYVSDCKPEVGTNPVALITSRVLSFNPNPCQL